ncbi:class I SAM-dependent methyltransferase [Ramlibacter sp. G-1-2-2]|uniref:Class I SAM-dependent methyltransferase n=1 Tax=Ramlibacter agri TaxID=2728837 RepID=A0A848GY88_9BURK|nr:class I SAM-dependent methyltransferase [Ramlibacter agri]NML43304.1 class I SAM-dependent methyltransferase [Ramlibacter agri]
MQDIGAQKFDAGRAGEYERQSRIGLAGYEACHELTACVLAATLGDEPRHVLVVGAGGTGQEVQAIGRLQPAWRFTAVDPSPPMLEQTIARLGALGLADRMTAVPGYVQDLPQGAQFDAATIVGVLHHVPGIEAKMELLRSVADRLPSGAPLILAGNAHAYASRPLLLKAWAQRWRMFGAGPEEVQAKLGKILHGAEPPESEAHALQMLEQAGFERAERFFSSLFWTAWIAFRK